MIRRLARAALAGCALSALLVVDASAGVPPGPRLAVLRFVANRTELLTVNARGGQSRRIPGVWSEPSWSADGNTLAFAKSSGGKHHRRTDIYLANADGSDPRRIPGTRGGSDPVLSPDGQMLAFARERVQSAGGGLIFNVTIWLLDLTGHSERQLTPWRSGVVETPASFTPDGSTLAVERERQMGDETRYTALALHLIGGPPTVLAENAIEPAYSPDGTQLALIVTGNEKEVVERLEVQPTHLAVANADGSGLRKLTHTPTETDEWGPGWDPSSQRLAYLKYAPSETHKSLYEGEDSIMEINPDGTCRTKILGVLNAILDSATWQPGPGREAGAISC